MRKVLLLSHGTMSEGIHNTLDIIIGHDENVNHICAYVEKNESVAKQVNKIVSDLKNDDELVIFTDIYGGSVTNDIVHHLSDERIFIVTGMNLPLIIETIINSSDNTKDILEAAIESARNGIMMLNREDFNNKEEEF